MSRHDTAPAPRAYSTREVGAALGINEATVRAEIARGRMRSVRVGRLIRVPDQALADYLQREPGREQVARAR